MREFCLVAETLNFTRSAELLFMPQPVLSRHIAQVEESLGAKLFERTTRSVLLTKAGELAYASFKKTLREQDRLHLEVASVSEGREGTLLVGSPYYWTEDHLEPVVEQFAVRHPHATVRLVSCQPAVALEELRRGDTDIALMSMIDDVDDTVRRVAFSEEPFAFVCSKDNPLSSCKTIGAAEILAAEGPVIGGAESLYQGVTDMINEFFSEHGSATPKCTFISQVDMLGLEIKRTGGYAIVPYGVRHMDRSYLAFIPVEGIFSAMKLALYYRLDNPNPLIPELIKAAL